MNTILFNLENGHFEVSNESGDHEKFNHSEIMGEDLYFYVGFPQKSCDSILKAIGSTNYLLFYAVDEARKRCENPYDCNYSENDIAAIKDCTQKFIEALKRELASN